MKKITFPLYIRMKRQTVADLHAALSFFNLTIEEGESDKRYFGTTTRDAVTNSNQKECG